MNEEDKKHIEKAVTVLRQGGVVIFPTDTAFGIGCRLDDEKAVKRLFRIRKRPHTQAASILVDTVTMAQNYVQTIPKKVLEELMEPFWPGALTIVLAAKTENIPDLVRGGGDTIGVRIPNHQVTRAIIRGVGVPILGPSANFHKKPTPYTSGDIDPKLIKLADYMVPGICSLITTSTVIDCTKKPWVILREGAITKEEIAHKRL